MGGLSEMEKRKRWKVESGENSFINGRSVTQEPIEAEVERWRGVLPEGTGPQKVRGHVCQPGFLWG